VRGLAAFLEREPELEVQQVADGLWTVAWHRARTVFAEGAASVIAVDTLGTPGAARAYARAIADVTGKPVTAIVYSNDHLARSGYGVQLARGVDVIAHAACARIVAGREPDQHSPVTCSVGSQPSVLEIDGVRLELLHPGPLVGTGALAVRFPDADVLFSLGPLANARYGLLPDYHLERFTDSVGALLALDWTRFVPGRYEVMTREQVQRALSYLEELGIVCQKAFADGVAIWDVRAMRRVVRQKLAGSFGDLDGFDEHVGITAFRVVHHYLMGGWGLEDTTRPELAYGDISC
jgi:hypothetical protein